MEKCAPMTRGNFWLCVEALAAALQTDESLNEAERDLQAMPPKECTAKLDTMMHIAGQLCRIDIRFREPLVPSL